MSTRVHSLRQSLLVVVMAVCAAVVVQRSSYALWQAGTPAGSPTVLQFDRTLVLNTQRSSSKVRMGDLNGDGNLDIVLAKGGHNPIVNEVFINDGRGRFPAAKDLGTADRSYAAELVDLDLDGDLDVVVGNDRPDSKTVHLNDGKGNFRLGSTYGRPEWGMRNAAVADLNSDGLPDIIAVNRGDSNYLCLNRGKGQFDADCLAFSGESATTITPADVNRDGLIVETPPPALSGRNITPADVNRDGFVDLVVPARAGQGSRGLSYVYLNDGKAGFSRRLPFGPLGAPIRVAEAADLDGDGFLDIVAIDESRGPAIHINQQGRAFAAGILLGSNRPPPYALAVGDLNVDGKIDIVVGSLSARATVYFNDGSGRHFTPVQFGEASATDYPFDSGFAIGDLDKDGYGDIAVARTGAPSVVYFGGPALRAEDRPAVPPARP
jgi:hypothetical protein